MLLIIDERSNQIQLSLGNDMLRLVFHWAGLGFVLCLKSNYRNWLILEHIRGVKSMDQLQLRQRTSGRDYGLPNLSIILGVNKIKILFAWTTMAKAQLLEHRQDHANTVAW